MLRRIANKRVCTLISSAKSDQTPCVNHNYHYDHNYRYDHSQSYGGSKAGGRLNFLGGVAAVTAAGLVAASSPSSTPVDPPTPDQYEVMDHLYDSGNLDELRSGLQYYADLDHAELLWRRARVEWEWNKRVRFATGGFQARRVEECMEMVDRAILLDDTISNVYLMKAVLCKAQCQLAGSIGKQIAGIKEMKSLLERALELDPYNGRAAQLLAIWHYEVAQIGALQRMVFSWWGGVPEGDSSVALNWAWKAQEDRPSVRNLLLLAKIYHSMGDVDKAKKYVAMAMEFPCSTADDGEALEEAAKFRKQLR